jgi:ribosomal protein L37AE/L43A
MLLSLIALQIPMAKIHQCIHCGHPHLEKVGVPGIRKCAKCGHLVDLRPKHWLKRLMGGLAA